MTTPRIPSPIDSIADSLFDGLSAINPSISLTLGLPVSDAAHNGFDDYSPNGLAAAHELRTRTLAAVDDAVAAAASSHADEAAPSTSAPSAAAESGLDATDRITVDALRERLGVAGELYEAGLQHSVLNVIESPLQQMRNIFDILPQRTLEDWSTISSTLAALPRSIDGHIESLRFARDHHGRLPARHQLERVAVQSRALASPASTIDAHVDRSNGLPDALRNDLRANADATRAAFGRLTSALLTEFLPHAGENEACGRDDYALHSRNFLGSAVDLDETYAWAMDELDRIDAEQREVANRIAPGMALFEVMEMLNREPGRALHSPDELREWMQTVADRALADLGGIHFDIPEPLRRIECMIAPSSTGAVYYSQPSDDFSRPGRMWWSVPEGVSEFATWQEKTTVYHEGVPGHHLQMGQAAFMAESLNTWRRHVCWVSGHGEGWALYAEALMAELGYMDEPGDYLGLLDSQRLRTTRVVVDIGFHLSLSAPRSLGGGTWNRAKAWEFLKANVATDHTFLAFELDRYLGWPGQAPSYKIGHRLWNDLRAEAQLRQGADFDLKSFHSRALDVGSVGLDTLRRALLG